MSVPASLPQVTIQTDALSAIKDVEQGLVEVEDFWVSCYAPSKPSVHGKVGVVISDEDRSQCAFKGWDGVECRRVAENTFHISCPALHVANRVIHFPTHAITLPAVPSTKTSSKLDLGITSIDVSPDGQSWVAGLGNGSIVVGTSPPASKKQTEPLIGTPHKASVSTVHFVPTPDSGATTMPSQVQILSCSDDFTLALTNLHLPANNTQQSSGTDLPPPILRLTSHTRAVTSSRPLPNMQATSAGRDGTLRIWDLSGSSSRQLGMVRSTGDVGIMAIAVSYPLVALALQSGHFDLVDLSSRTTLFTSSSDGFEYTKRGPLDAIALHPLPGSGSEYLIATGSQRGVLSFYVCAVQDGKTSVKTLGSCVRNGAGISDIKLVSPTSTNEYPRVLVATTDGLPYQLRIAGNPASSADIEFAVAAEYAGGPDCSPVRSIVGHVGGTVWLAGDDGVIWVYQE